MPPAPFHELHRSLRYTRVKRRRPRDLRPVAGNKGRMETEVRIKFLARLAERGLSLKSYDGATLIVHYDPEADADVNKGLEVQAETLSRYVQETIAGMPGSEMMFPGLRAVEVEPSATS